LIRVSIDDARLKTLTGRKTETKEWSLWRESGADARRNREEASADIQMIKIITMAKGVRIAVTSLHGSPVY